MTVEVVEIDDHVTDVLRGIASAAGATEQEFQRMQRVLAGLSGESAQGLVSAMGVLRGTTSSVLSLTERMTSAEAAVTSEIQKQAALEAKIATFDANRFTQIKKLEAEYAKLQKDATPKEAPAPAAPGPGFAPGSLAGAAAGVAAGIAQSIVSEMKHVIEEVITTAIELVRAGAELAIAATTFREESIAGLESFAGGLKGAERIYDQSIALANALGKRKEDVVQQVRHLMDLGFKGGEVDAMVRAAAGVAAGRGAEAGDRFEKLIEQTQAKGKFDQKTLTALAKTGVEASRVYENLARVTGKSVAEVQAAVKKGQIDAATGIDAMLGAAQDKFGGLADKAGKTVPGLLNRLRNDFTGLFDGIDTSPFKDALTSAAHVLEGGAGKDLKAGLGNFFGSLFHALFDPFKGPEGEARIRAFIGAVTNALNNGAAAFQRIAPIISLVVDLLARMSETDSGGDSVLSRIGDALEWLFRTAVPAIDTLYRLWEAIGAAEGLELPDLGELGTEMMNGLIAGIEGGASGVVDAIVDAVSGAVDAAKSFLGIASPSKVFASLGDFSAQGFAGGIAANDAPSSAAAGMAQRSVGAAASAYAPVGPGGASAGAGGDAGGGMNVSYSPVIQVKADTEEGGKAAAQAAHKQLEADFRAMLARVERDRREAA